MDEHMHGEVHWVSSSAVTDGRCTLVAWMGFSLGTGSQAEHLVPHLRCSIHVCEWVNVNAYSRTGLGDVTPLLYVRKLKCEEDRSVLHRGVGIWAPSDLAATPSSVTTSAIFSLSLKMPLLTAGTQHHEVCSKMSVLLKGILCIILQRTVHGR